MQQYNSQRFTEPRPTEGHSVALPRTAADEPEATSGYRGTAVLLATAAAAIAGDLCTT